MNPPRRALRTLLVEPSDAFLTGVTGWLGGRPEIALVGTARTGPEALAAVSDLDPDLVVVDAVLPELDGFRVVRAIKASPRAPLVVVTSFWAHSAARNAAFAAGADGFVAKDDFAGTFDRLLAELLDGRAREPKHRERSVPRGWRTEPAP
ncbi:MAG: response regulator [Acidobacteriota bacterium]|nr:MAG: response regulator [Acidobacteriota bacterium]